MTKAKTNKISNESTDASFQPENVEVIAEEITVIEPSDSTPKEDDIKPIYRVNEENVFAVLDRRKSEGLSTRFEDVRKEFIILTGDLTALRYFQGQWRLTRNQSNDSDKVIKLKERISLLESMLKENNLTIPE